jgi:hypothetical protein
MRSNSVQKSIQNSLYFSLRKMANLRKFQTFKLCIVHLIQIHVFVIFPEPKVQLSFGLSFCTLVDPIIFQHQDFLSNSLKLSNAIFEWWIHVFIYWLPLSSYTGSPSLHILLYMYFVSRLSIQSGIAKPT